LQNIFLIHRCGLFALIHGMDHGVIRQGHHKDFMQKLFVLKNDLPDRVFEYFFQRRIVPHCRYVRSRKSGVNYL
jgi:hypothetical protein